MLITKDVRHILPCYLCNYGVDLICSYPELKIHVCSELNLHSRWQRELASWYTLIVECEMQRAFSY